MKQCKFMGPVLLPASVCVCVREATSRVCVKQHMPFSCSMHIEANGICQHFHTTKQDCWTSFAVSLDSSAREGGGGRGEHAAPTREGPRT